MIEYEVLWTEAAKSDLETTVGFIAAEDPLNALQILEKLEARARTLRQFPECDRVVPELRAADVFLYREIIERPWRIVYRHDNRRVYVMALFDARRDLASVLLERLTR
jgi:plasmid stabilization system protein ParE